MRKFRKLVSAAVLIALLMSLVGIDSYAAPQSDFVVSKGVLTGYLGLDGDVVIPSNLGIKEIGMNAFKNKGIQSVVIPEGVTSIKRDAFNSCSALTSVTLPNTLTSIGDQAFMRCTELLTINLPSGLKSIGNCAFYYCSKLQALAIPESVTFIDNGAFNYCKSITEITWPKNVTRLGYSVFGGCTKLAIVNLPDTVTEIGGWAFSGCENLKTFKMPASIKTIGTSALNETGLPDPILINNNSVLCYVPETYTSYTVPATVTTINGGAFRDSVYLKSVSIPDSVTVIGDEAFKGCINLASISLPAGLTTIGEQAFRNCQSLTVLTIPPSVSQIGGQAFSLTALKSPILSPDGKILYFVPAAVPSYTIPETVDTIKAGAFEGCAKLTSIDLPDRIKSIGQFAFSECSSLKAITIPNGVTSIGQWMFAGCSSLALISIPPSVKSIGGYAFYGCTALTSFIVPKTVKDIYWNAFEDCSNMKFVYFSNPGTAIYSEAFKNCDQLTLYAQSGSSAQVYAESNNIPFMPLTIKAALTKSTVIVNGSPVAFEAYNFDGNNYFKLRDLAKALNGTEKQFEIDFNATYNVIYLTAGKTYTPAGGELTAAGKAAVVTAARTFSKVYLDGKEISLPAYIINGSNYFKLRDIAAVIDFGVAWDGNENLITIDTTIGYD